MDDDLYELWAFESSFHTACKSYANVEATTAKLVEYAQYRSDTQWSVQTSHADAIATRDLWANVFAILGNTRQGDDAIVKYGERVTWAQAVAGVAHDVRRTLLSNSDGGTSTNDASNFYRMAKRDASATWLRSYEVVSVLHYFDGEANV